MSEYYIGVVEPPPLKKQFLVMAIDVEEQSPESDTNTHARGYEDILSCLPVGRRSYAVEGSLL